MLVIQKQVYLKKISSLSLVPCHLDKNSQGEMLKSAVVHY